jgi:hypothetical protein
LAGPSLTVSTQPGIGNLPWKLISKAPIRNGCTTDLTLQKLAVELDELLGLYIPSNQHDSVRMLFTPSRLLIVCGYSKSRIRLPSNKASLSHAGFVYTHIDVPDGDSTCHTVRRWIGVRGRLVVSFLRLWKVRVQNLNFASVVWAVALKRAALDQNKS